MRGILIVFFIVLGFLALFVMGLSVVGLVKKPPDPRTYAPVKFSDQVGTFSKSCTTEVAKCNTDSDCTQTCREQQQGIDMACVQLSDPNDKTKMLPNQKVCAPRQAIMRCGRTLGGVLTWSGWADADRMEWNCLCQFPSYASNQNCTQFNSGICSAYDPSTKTTKSFYNWNVAMGRPELGSCTCPNGYSRQTVSSNQMQRCVPNKLTGLYQDLATSEGFGYVGCYSNVTGTPVTITGYSDATSKIGTSPFMAISGTQMIALQNLGNATLSQDVACQRVCSDDASRRCAGTTTKNQKVWAVYKKN
jgi:hypothetical protein